MVHPLNYNATTGEEMRLLNPDYPGGNWVVAGELLQCGSADANADINVRMNCLLRGNNPNIWVQQYKNVVLSPGADRVTEAEIDDNAPIRADVSNIFASALPERECGNSGRLADRNSSAGLPLAGWDLRCDRGTLPGPGGCDDLRWRPGRAGRYKRDWRTHSSSLRRHRPNAYSRPAVSPSPTQPEHPLQDPLPPTSLEAHRRWSSLRGCSTPPAA